MNLTKIGVVFLALSLLGGMGVAHTGHTTHEDVEQEQPVNATEGPIPDLPSDASPIAQSVVDTINTFLTDTGRGLSNLGTALANLLGGG